MQVLQTPKEAETRYLDSMYVMSHSMKTVNSYRTSINHLRAFLLSRYDLDEIRLISKIKSEEINVYDLLRDFVVYLDKKEIRPKGLRGYISAVKGYLRYLGIRINSDDFKQLVKIPRYVKAREVPLTKEMILRLLRISSPKLQTAILVAISSGVRIGELVQLKLSDIDFSSNPTKLQIRGSTSKSKFTRDAFITTEATNALKDHLKRNFGWDANSSNEHLKSVYVFGRTSSVKTADAARPENAITHAASTLQIGLKLRIAKIPELNMRNENGLRSVHFHAFRKFFRTAVGNVCGRDFAEAIIGHSFYMDTYYVLSEEQKRELYLKAEPYLTISDFKAVENNIKVLSENYQKLEKKYDDVVQSLKEIGIHVPESLLKK